MTTTLTQAQLDAVCDAQDEDPALEALPAQEVAKRLARAGDPLFAGFGVEQESPEPKATQPATDSDGGQQIPAFDTGAPAATALVPVEPRAHQAQAAVQLPAKVDDRPLPPARATMAAVEGMEDIGEESMLVPTLQLKQAQTKDKHDTGVKDVPDGDWFLTIDPSDHGARDVAFLEIKPGRQFSLPYEDEDARERVLDDLGLGDVVPDDVGVICRSNDRVLPTVRDDQEWAPLSKNCSSCPHSKWSRSNKGKRIPPACSDTYRALVVDMTDGGFTPARMFLKGGAIRPTMGFLTNARIAAKRAGAPLFAFSIALSSKERTNKKGNFFVPHFTIGEQLDEALVNTLRATREGLIGQGQLDAEHQQDGGGDAE